MKESRQWFWPEQLGNAYSEVEASVSGFMGKPERSGKGLGLDNTFGCPQIIEGFLGHVLGRDH